MNLGDLMAMDLKEAARRDREMHAENARLKEAIRWALGETDDFPPRESGQGAYWWRTELRHRSGLTYTTPPTTE